MIVKCKLCSASFYTKPSWVNAGAGKYCSLACKYKATRKGQDIPCLICAKVVYHPKGRIERSKSKKYFCSKSCQTKWRNSYFVGEKHGNWKNGNSSYQSILGRNRIDKICTLCKEMDARVLAVHHINHKHTDNRLANLAWLCHNCHHLVHHDSLDRQKFLKIISRRGF